MDQLSAAIDEVKKAKATNLYWQMVKARGREGYVQRALDSVSREEAIATLQLSAKVQIFKFEGRVIIQ